MKRKLLYRVCLMFFCMNNMSAISQNNLVPNWSFEEYTFCLPSNGIIVAFPWYSPIPTSPDYFNACENINHGVPKNLFGFQKARSGVAYSGIGNYIDIPPFYDNWREYIQTFLNSALENNLTYCIQFFVSLADTCMYATNRMGLLFSDSAITCSSCYILNYTPQIESSSGNFLLDAAGWMKISGIYTANGTEKYITLGNFRDDANTDIWVVNNNTSESSAYYYLDDVSIVALTPVNAGIDDTICQGDSMLLGGVPVFAADYLWQPATGLDKPTAPNPKASPTQTTTYIVQQTQCSSITYDTVTVFVKECPLPPDTTKPPEPFILPTLLQKDEYFVISGLPPGSRLWVYDIAGRLVYHSLHYRHTLHSSELATGMYLIRLQMPDGTQYRSKLLVVK